MSIFTQRIDMLHGSLWDKLILFSLPLAFTAFLEQLFNIADVMILGQYLGKDAVAAVGTNFPLIIMFICLFIGLSLGSNVVIAQCIGAQRHQEANDAVHASWLLAVISGFALTILGQFVTQPFLDILKVPPHIASLSDAYLQTYLWSMPAISLYNFEAAMFRSRGDTQTPLIGLALSVILNFTLNIWFVQAFTDGVFGVALATVISISVSALVLLVKLKRAPDVLHLSFRKLHIHPPLMKEIIRIGWPAALQGMVFCISNLLIQEAINRLGPDAMAASSISTSIELCVYCLINAFGQAGTTFISQNYGARNILRCLEITKWALILNLVFTTVTSILVLIFAHQIIYVFNDDPSVVHLTIQRMWFVVLLEPIQAIIDVYAGAMRGYGFSMMPAMLTLLGICGVRIVWLYTIFEWNPTFEWLMATYPVSWGVTGGMLVILYKYFIRHLPRE